jgi:serine protease inhibitor
MMMMMAAHQRLLFAAAWISISGIVGVVSAQNSSLQESQIAFGDNAVLGDLYLTRLDKNQCSSALGISMMMSLLYPAMSEEARTQLQKVFGYPSSDGEPLVWANITNDINSRYNGSCLFPDQCDFGKNPLVSISNSVWIQTGGAPVDANYASILGDLLYPIDFSSDTAGGEVNTWVNQSTNGLIDSVVGMYHVQADPGS